MRMLRSMVALLMAVCAFCVWAVDGWAQSYPAKVVRLLAVTSAKRIAFLPDYPTVAESGYPGFEFGSWNGIMVPAKTPKEIITRIHSATMSALTSLTVTKRMAELGYIVVGNQPEQFAAHIKSEIASLGHILRNLRGTAE